MKVIHGKTELINALRDYDSESLEKHTQGNSKEYINNLVNRSDSFMALDDNNQFITIAGIYPLWHGVGEAWLLSSSLLYKHKFYIAKSILKGLWSIIQDRQYHRVQTTVDNSFPDAVKFIEWLGFKREGLMKAYSANKQDFLIYSVLLMEDK